MRFKDLSFLGGVTALVIISLGFRFLWLGHVPGINGDEAWLGWKALRVIQGEPFNWKTHTGNLINPFYFFPLVGLHEFFHPSFALLRVVAIVSGILALPVNWFLCRRTFDLQTASISTLLLSVLPVNIAYSRFGWEPSQTLLFSLPVLYCSLLAARETNLSRRWICLSVFSVMAAFLVHPMNAVLLVFPLTMIVVRWPHRVWDAFLLRQRLYAAFFWLPLICGVGALLFWKGSFLETRLHNFRGIKEIGPFLLGSAQLFSGTSTYRYIPGSVNEGIQFCDLAVGLLIGAGIVSVIWRWRKNACAAGEIGLLLGLAVGVPGFWLILGPAGVSPENARYALWMIAPCTLLVARSASAFMEQKPSGGMFVKSGVLILSALLLFGFWTRYFAFFLTTGGAADPTFRTGPREPKLAAAELILKKQSARHNTGQPFVIASSDWWVYWPMRYYSVGVPHLTMLLGDEMNAPANARLMSTALQRGDLWFAEFSSLKNTANLRAGMKQGGIRFEEYTTRGYDDQPVITVFHLYQR
jgi:hypothetical protein